MHRALLPLLLMGCASPPPPEETSRVEGRVKLADPAMTPKRRRIVLDPGCAAVGDARAALDEDRLVDRDGGMPWVLVYLDQGLEARKFDIPKEPALLELRGHRLVPHVLGLRAGQELRIRNSDDHPYCVHGLPFNNKEFNFHLSKRGAEFVQRPDFPEVAIKLKDDLHPWMAAWVAVFPHPFFAVTDEIGRFEIGGLPPGKYRLKAWHVLYESVSKEIDVQGKGALTANLEFTKRKE